MRLEFAYNIVVAGDATISRAVRNPSLWPAGTVWHAFAIGPCVTLEPLHRSGAETAHKTLNLIEARAV